MSNENGTKTNFLTPLAGALLLAAALFGVAAIIAFGSLGRQNPWGWAFGVLALLALAGWFVGRRQSERMASDKYSRQRTVVGANSVLSVLLLLVLLVGANYIAARRHKVFDLTQNRINTLSDQTTKALAELDSPVKMTYVWAQSEMTPQIDPSAQSILEAYDNASDKVEIEYLNAAQDLLKFQSLNLHSFSGQPILLVEKADAAAKGNAPPSARQEVSVVDEQNITSALLKLANPQPRVLYFLTGHGEQTPLQTGAEATLSSARSSLEAQNYTLKTLTLTGAKATIPEDAAAVVAVAPRVDLSAAEEKKLEEYLNGQGRVAIYLEMATQPMPRWKSLISSLNVQVLDGLVLELDPQRSGGNPQIVAGIVEDPSRHPVLRSVNGAVLFPGVVPLRTAPAPAPEAPDAPPPSGPNVTPLLETTINSSSVTTQTGTMQQSAEGPFVIAAAIEESDAPPPMMPGAPPPPPSGDGMRAIVVGNAAFASDGVFNQFGNSSFFLGSINWVVGNDALVSIPPKEPVTNTLDMTDATRNFAILLSLVALPLGMLLIGTVVWWRRR